MKKRAVVSAIMAMIVGITYGQLQVTTAMDPVELVQSVLVGSCVGVTNISYNDVLDPSEVPPGIGSFSNGSTTNLGINEGIILSTGNVMDAAGPATDFASSNNQTGSDPDLVMLAGNNINDRAVLEFDFVPEGNTLSFRFVFASEEYPNFVCTGFNDAFGFFLSGPGISGPFSNNSMNIALVPGTVVPIAINTVNSGVAAGSPSNCEEADPNWQANSIYYVDNTGGQTIAYNGFTVVLTAEAQVQCGQTYHIKLAIGDAGDSSYDSAVFLEAGSFNSVPFIPSLVPGPSIVDNTIYRSCLPLSMEFQRTSCDVNTTETVNMSYGGTAVMGTDLTPDFPTSLVFEPGESELSIPFMAPEGATGQLTFNISLETLDCEGQVTTSTFEFLIDDAPPMQVEGADHLIQCGQEVMLVPIFDGGFPPYTLDWGTAGVVDSLAVSPTEFSTYTVMVTDTCGNTATTEFTVDIIPLPPIYMTIIGSNTLVEGCETNQINIIRPLDVPGDLVVDLSLLGGQANSDYGLPASATILADNFNVLVPFVPPADAVDGDMMVTVIGTFTDNCGRTVDAFVEITIVDAPDIVLTGNAYTIDCAEADSLLISVGASGGVGGSVISWDNTGNVLGHEVWIPVTSSVSFNVTATDACGRTANTTVNVTVDCEVIIPNVFTPNGDGMNDLWEIEGILHTTNTLRVFNRWGQVVYETTNYRNTWRAQDITDGTYFYELLVTGHEKPYTGHVTILRN